MGKHLREEKKKKKVNTEKNKPGEGNTIGGERKLVGLTVKNFLIKNTSEHGRKSAGWETGTSSQGHQLANQHST